MAKYEMFLKTLQLTNFRNYQSKHIEFNKPITYINGQNGTGKSNIIEAIYLLATGNSFRTSEIGNLIGYGSIFTKVAGTVAQDESADGSRTKDLEYTISQINELDVSADSENINRNINLNEIEIIINKNILESEGNASAGINRTYNRNGVPRSKKNYSGRFRAVVFSPESMDLVSGPSSVRRRYLDLVISQKDDNYRRLIGIYEKTRLARNKLLYQLKYGTARLTELDYWNKLLVDSGIEIAKYRMSFINFANMYLQINANKYFCGGYQLGITYLANAISNEALVGNINEEISAERTLVGPHRDDFNFVLNKPDTSYINLSKYGSRGNQRLAIYLLKLAETEYLSDENGRPLILLDDIFSELDSIFRTAIISNMANYQTVLTGVEPLSVVGPNFNSRLQSIPT